MKRAFGILGVLTVWLGTGFSAEPISRHVILIGVDGLRPDAMLAADAPRMKAALLQGAYSLSAQTIYPSATLPSHASMLTGLSPERHRVRSNHWYFREKTVRAPTIFALARAAGYHTAMFAAKSRFVYFLQPGALNNFRGSMRDFYPGATRRSAHATAWFDQTVSSRHWPWRSASDCVRIATVAAEYLRNHKPNLIFVHFADPDVVGHTVGWMSVAQLVSIQQTDAAIGLLMDEVSRHSELADTIFIVTSDHGGRGLKHGRNIPEDMTIPWLAWGSGVARGHQIQQPIVTYDTAATVLYVLGLSVPSHWDGRPVREAFQEPERAFAAN